MHALFPHPPGRLCGLLLAAMLAVPAAQATDRSQTPARPQAGTPEPLVERITHQDAGSRIDELRVGGQTRSIRVQTPAAVPAYEVVPQEQQSQGQAGRSSWRLLRF